MLLLPTAYFGSISWYRQLVSHECVHIAGEELFVRQTFRNRCMIATPQGSAKLSIPVEMPHGSASAAKSIVISKQKDWRKDHWRSLQSNYASAPFFDHYASDIHALIYSNEENLLAFNQQVTSFMLQQFGLAVRFTDLQEGLPVLDKTRVNFEKCSEADSYAHYQQVYFGEPVFLPNLSILDLLFCIGPVGRNYLTCS